MLSIVFIHYEHVISFGRLDFLSFSIAQPGLDSVCSTDSFTVLGVKNKVPVICGDNAGQHSITYYDLY